MLISLSQLSAADDYGDTLSAFEEAGEIVEDTGVTSLTDDTAEGGTSSLDLRGDEGGNE